MMLRRTVLLAIPGAVLAARLARDSAAGEDRSPRGGEPLRLTGRLLAAETGAPLAGYQIHVYQTDGDGYYNRPDNDARRAALRATLTTDDDGRYGFTTIVPGHYPGRRAPKHIHVHLSGPDVPEHWIDDYWFAGDPYLDAHQKAQAIALSIDRRGRWRGRRDLILDPALVDKHKLVDDGFRQRR